MPNRRQLPERSTEDQLIERITRRLTSRRGANRRPLVLGTGDDAAILRFGPREDWVISSDFSLEGVHFLPGLHPPAAIGFRALARAVSDLAAMGAQPEFFLLSLALPRERTGRWLDQVLTGMRRAAKDLNIGLIGGDTTEWPKVTLALTVMGRTAPGRALRRDGARPGDQIFVSGQLGAAALGLEILRRQSRGRRGRIGQVPSRRDLHQPHLYPRIPIELGIHLAESGLASAAIDLSDGLSSDLARLVRASNVAAKIFLDRLPAARVPAALAGTGLDSLKLALHGGEDYGLLFTVRPAHAAKVPSSFRGTPITWIGEIVGGRGVQAVDSAGRARPLSPAGWDPFRKRP